MRKRRGTRCSYGSLTLLECLLAIAVPEIAAAQSCPISANPGSPVTVGSASILTATCGVGVGGAPTFVSWSWNPSMTSCSSPRQSSFSSQVLCTFHTAGSTTLQVTPYYGCFVGSTTSYTMAVSAATAPPTGCTVSAVPSPVPAAGGPVRFVVSCSGGGAPTSYAYAWVRLPGVVGSPTPYGNPATLTFPANPFPTLSSFRVNVDVANAGGTDRIVGDLPQLGSGPPPLLPPSACSVTALPTALPIGGGSVTLTASCSAGDPPSSFAWSAVPSLSGLGTTNRQTVTLTRSTTFSVVASNEAGSATPVTVTVPVATVGVPACTVAASSSKPNLGQPVTLTATCSNSPASYSWTGGCTPTGPTCTDVSTTAVTRSYTVVATNATGSSSPATATVTWQTVVVPPPVPGTGAVVGASNGSANSGFNSLIRDDGTLWSWGTNRQHTLGDASTTSRSVPGQVNGLSGIVATASALHTLALQDAKLGGRVYAWGPNDFGELGQGSLAAQASPALVPGLANIVGVAAGDNFSLALRSDGTVLAWGRNDLGQLGDGTSTNRASPVPVAGLSNVVSIAASASHAAAVKGDGTVWVWARTSMCRSMAVTARSRCRSRAPAA